MDYTADHGDQKDSEAAHSLLQAFIRSIPDAVLICDYSGVLIECNTAFTDIFGWTRDEILGVHVTDLMFLPNDPEIREEQERVFHTLQEGRTYQNYKSRRVNKQGKVMELSITYSPVRDESGDLIALSGIYRDVTELYRLEAAVSAAETNYRLIAENMKDMIALLDLTGLVRYASPSYLHVLGFPREEFEGTNCFRLVHEEDLYLVQNKFGRLLTTGEQQTVEFRYSRADGSYVWVETQASLLQEPDGSHSVLAVSRDIGGRKELEEQLASMALEDTLTGTANRRLFKELLEQAIRFSDRDRGRLAMIHVNLNGFRAVNETYGRAAGDLVLKNTADRLQECVGEKGKVCRTGGDEFLLMLYRVRDAEDAARTASECMNCIHEPHAVAGGEITLTGSMGISLYPEDTADAIELMNNAHLAMFKAKESGANRYAFYAEKQDQEPANNIHLQ
ncbi:MULTISPECIES: PAS domain S-box protein [Paenibacillus]|uniref:PAS domain S-box protein n=1 Tax=Paenibacillus TaxID=44249 RepID=UPI0022B8B1EE|nr:PAS domain S-box protein [Paenibacillus caseinilyticus]MCZ8523622.1 PAS domain S-box protein [Paenibacillus caseinilyticus]